MRHVGYDSTITTRTGPFWESAGAELQREWRSYSRCRAQPSCRASLCAARHLTPGATWRGSVWAQSSLARAALADARAVQWNLPELVLWPGASRAAPSGPAEARGEYTGSVASPAMAALRLACLRNDSAAGARSAMWTHRCVRNAWLHNLTAFLAARRKVKHGAISVK